MRELTKAELKYVVGGEKGDSYLEANVTADREKGNLGTHKFNNKSSNADIGFERETKNGSWGLHGGVRKEPGQKPKKELRFGINGTF